MDANQMGNAGSSYKAFRARAFVRPWHSTAFSLILILSAAPCVAQAKTVAQWLFDEQQGLYPSCVLGDSATDRCPLVLGMGGQIVAGKFGNALEPLEQPKIALSRSARFTGFEHVSKIAVGRKTPPMDWSNANFCALMTRGEKHLRQEVGFASPTSTRLNLGDFDWTVEFWYQPTRKSDGEGTVFEIGEGPRGENDHVTELFLNADREIFTFRNQPSATNLRVPSDGLALSDGKAGWHHLAFVYDKADRQ